ncbi:MAG TPA: DUF6368 family protein [Thermoanaerobaculia bacterium]|nr:DUF6368 family protein [Thermoanaerobaculia bacterium]
MGPSITILLPYEPDASDFAALDDLAKTLGSSNTSAADFHVETTIPIGGTVEAGEGGRPLVAGFEDPLFEEGEGESLQSSFGFVPAAIISVGAMCNDRVDHRVLGELAVYLAQHFGGIIGFNGALGVARVVHGKLAEIRYEVEGRRLFAHVGDVAFMHGWLRDPAFHLVK